MSSETPRRTYLDSHPWLAFALDTRQLGPEGWMALGAAQSKADQVANTMLPPDVAADLYIMYLAKGVRATTAIEGNTLTETEVRDRILHKSKLPKSQEYQGREIDNMVAACGLVASEIVSGQDCRLSVEKIVAYNGMVLKDLPLDERIVPGTIRNYHVTVGKYRGPPPQDCAFLLERFCDFINDGLRPTSEEYTTAFGILRAIVAHLYLAWIHPFGDGNGRTARLIEFQLLLSAGVPAVSAHLLTNHYNKTRTAYYHHLDLATRSPLLFAEYAIQGFADMLDAQIRRIRKHQYAITWKDLVYDKFKGQKTSAAHRQRMLALALGSRKHAVAASDLRTLTAELSMEYSQKTPKTIARDVNSLARLNLILKLPGRRVAANRPILQGFLPGRRAKQKWM